MTEPKVFGYQVALTILQLFPPPIRESLIEVPDFVRCYEIPISGTLSFGAADLHFDQADFFQCVRQLYAGFQGDVIVHAANGERFVLSSVEREHGSYIEARSEARSIDLPSFWFLFSDANLRLKYLKDLLVEKNIQVEEVEVWRDRLADRPLDDLEVDVFLSDTKLNLLDVALKVRNEVASGETEIGTLVPPFERYYERLIGARVVADDLEVYIRRYGSSHFSKLLQWDKHRGLAHALLLCTHGDLSAAVDIRDFDEPDVMSFYNWLHGQGDRASQVAGIEVGVAALDKFPDLGPILCSMIETIVNEDPDDIDGRIRLASSLFVFVDGELARLGILRHWPPFLRRLASFAQASVIERELLSVGVHSGKFADWAVSGRGNFFFLQTLVDLRHEPRWLPDFADANQLRAEFVSRINNVGRRYEEHLATPLLRELLLGDDGLIRRSLKFPVSYLPGPLEGGRASPSELPEEMVSKLRDNHNESILRGNNFAGLVNSALVFRITSEHAQLVIKVLQQANHRLSLGEDGHLTFSLLSGLAVVAAVSRTPELAREIIHLSNNCSVERILK